MSHLLDLIIWKTIANFSNKVNHPVVCRDIYFSSYKIMHLCTSLIGISTIARPFPDAAKRPVVVEWSAVAVL